MTDRVLVRSRFDPTSESSVAVRVAETLSMVVESPIALPPLAYTIDTDSLDALFTPLTRSSIPHGLRLTFPYERWQVTIDGSGEITVSLRPGSEATND